MSKNIFELFNKITKYDDALLDRSKKFKSWATSQINKTRHLFVSDSSFENLMSWAEKHPAEAQQLALDSTQLLASADANMEQLRNKNFCQRCWMRMNGDAGEIERATTNALISLQKFSVKYIDALMERQILQTQSIITIKNNLNSLAATVADVQADVATAFHEIGKNREMILDNRRKIAENREMIFENREMIFENRKAIAETRLMLAALAQRTESRFKDIEHRTKSLEISSELQGWLLGLEERDYEKEYPSSIVRMLRVINDFYQIKSGNLNYNDILFMKKAIRTVGLDPKEMLSLDEFITRLINELIHFDRDASHFSRQLDENAPQNIDDYSKFVLKEISSPVFMVIHAIKLKFRDRNNLIVELQDDMNISGVEALHKILRRDMLDIHVNLDYKFPLGEAAVEILDCMQLARNLTSPPPALVAPPSPDPTPAPVAPPSPDPTIEKKQKARKRKKKQKARKRNWRKPDCLHDIAAVSLFIKTVSHLCNENKNELYIGASYDTVLTSFLGDISTHFKIQLDIEDIFCCIYDTQRAYIRYKDGLFFCYDDLNNECGMIDMKDIIYSYESTDRDRDALNDLSWIKSQLSTASEVIKEDISRKRSSYFSEVISLSTPSFSLRGDGYRRNLEKKYNENNAYLSFIRTVMKAEKRLNRAEILFYFRILPYVAKEFAKGFAKGLLKR